MLRHGSSEKRGRCRLRVTSGTKCAGKLGGPERLRITSEYRERNRSNRGDRSKGRRERLGFVLLCQRFTQVPNLIEKASLTQVPAGVTRTQRQCHPTMRRCVCPVTT